MGLIPGSGRSPGEGNGNPLQHSCQKIPKDRRAWWATVHGVTKSDMTEATQHTHSSLRNKFTGSQFQYLLGLEISSILGEMIKP